MVGPLKEAVVSLRHHQLFDGALMAQTVSRHHRLAPKEKVVAQRDAPSTCFDGAPMGNGARPRSIFLILGNPHGPRAVHISAAIQELVTLQPDLILTSSTPAAHEPTFSPISPSSPCV
jgi:hypothetical protein